MTLDTSKIKSIIYRPDVHNLQTKIESFPDLEKLQEKVDDYSYKH